MAIKSPVDHASRVAQVGCHANRRSAHSSPLRTRLALANLRLSEVPVRQSVAGDRSPGGPRASVPRARLRRDRRKVIDRERARFRDFLRDFAWPRVTRRVDRHGTIWIRGLKSHTYRHSAGVPLRRFQSDALTAVGTSIATNDPPRTGSPRRFRRRRGGLRPFSASLSDTTR
jgi:hypothetical protein